MLPVSVATTQMPLSGRPSNTLNAMKRPSWLHDGDEWPPTGCIAVVNARGLVPSASTTQIVDPACAL